MSTIAKLSVLLGLDSSQFSSGIKKAESEAKFLGSAMSAIGTGLAAFGVGFGLNEFAGFLKDSVNEAREGEKAQQKLAAVLTATGNATGYTLEQLNSFTEAATRATGVEDDLITGAQGVLATFRNIGGTAFPQAMQAALDLSAVMGQDLQSSVVQIGKALNDPINGLTALRRVGVSFSAEQQTMIKRLQESGDLLGAQGVILAELQKEFGGAAAKMADATDKFGVAFDALKESIGQGPIGDTWNKILEDLTFHIDRAAQGWKLFNMEVMGVPEAPPTPPPAPMPPEANGGPTEEGVKMLEKQRKELEFQIATWGLTNDEVEIYRLQLEGVNSEDRVRIEQQQAVLAELQKQKDALEEQAKVREEIGKREQEDFDRQMAAAREFNRAGKQAAENVRDQLDSQRSTAKQLLDAEKLTQQGFLDPESLQKMQQGIADQLRQSISVPEVKFAGPAEQGSQAAISTVNKFLGTDAKKNEEKALLMQQVTHLRELVRLIREERNNQLQIVEDI